METNNTPLPTNTTPTTKKRSSYVSLTDFIADSNTALTNALLPDVLPLLVKRGYTKASIQTKLTEPATLQALDEAQKKEYGKQYEATQAYSNAEDALHEDYIDHIGLARIVFKKDVAAQIAMGLKGTRSISANGYASQALLFYNTALHNATYMQKLATKGIEEAELLAQ